VSADITLPPDAEARRRIAEDLDTTLFVEAAAGTGKTTALVGRIVSLLRSGKGTLDRVVAVTFTEKAAGEMKLRLRSEIERVRSDPDLASAERSRLDAALEKLELARIGTIHGFCSDLLHERPIEAGVDPLFEIASPDISDRYLDEAFESWFQRALADPPEGVRRILRRRPRGPFASGPRDALRGAVGSLCEHRDFEAPWTRPPFDRRREIDAVMETLEALAALSSRAEDPEDWLAKNLANIQRFVAENALREGVRARDHDALEAELRELARTRRIGWHWKGRNRRWFAPEVPRVDVLERRDEVKLALDALMEVCDADLAALLREELRPVVAAYQDLKRKAGALDFVDLLIGARDLLARDRAARTELQERFTAQRIDYAFLDTSKPLDLALFAYLSARERLSRIR
jgi:ATP-dependent exoDNAse (exonuclease V) beta subunit